MEKLEAAFQPLLGQPQLGPSRDYLSPGLRAHFYRDYAVYYLPTEQEIIIVRVVHGRRDRDAMLAED